VVATFWRAVPPPLPVGFCGGPVPTALPFMPGRLADAPRGHLLVHCRRAVVGKGGSLACLRRALGSLRRRRDRHLESLSGPLRAILRCAAVGAPSALGGQLRGPRSRARCRHHRR
jgi:hypothetical protein